MSSGEILRGLKKLSLTSSSGDDPTPPSAADPPPPRPRKSKSGQQLKKRSSAGNDDEDPKARSPRSPGSFRPLRYSTARLYPKCGELNLVETIWDFL